MTIFYNFTPDGITPPQYIFTLDGVDYNATVIWNVSAERYYLNITDMAGTLIFSLPLIASPKDYDISISEGYFMTKIVYRIDNKQIEVI